MGELAQAVFLVGGLGTRLGALTRDKPKPLMDVAGRPFLSWLVQAAAAQGVRDFLFLSGYHAPQIEAAMAGLKAAGARVDYSVEPEPLGTGGALAFAQAALAERFFLFNGDSLFHVSLADLARSDPDQEPLARLALREEADASRYGSVELSGDRITGFREKENDGSAGLINGGVYWMQRALLEQAPAGRFSLERDLFPKLVAAGRVEGRVFNAPVIDIGLPQTLGAAQEIVPEALSRPPG